MVQFQRSFMIAPLHGGFFDRSLASLAHLTVERRRTEGKRALTRPVEPPQKGKGRSGLADGAASRRAGADRPVIQGPVATSGPCLLLVINFVLEVLHLTTISSC